MLGQSCATHDVQSRHDRAPRTTTSFRRRAMSTPGERLRKARKDAGYATATDAAKALSLSRDTYLQHENGNRDYDDASAQLYARRFKTTPEWLRFGRVGQDSAPKIPILGFAGANPDGTVLFAHGQGTHDTVPPPPNGSLTARALEVRGHSMPFFAEDGAIIYFDHQRPAPSSELLGHVVVVELDTGEVLVKRLLKGSRKNVFDLESIAGPTRRDAKLNWVAQIVCVIPPLEARRLVQRATHSA